MLILPLCGINLGMHVVHVLKFVELLYVQVFNMMYENL